MREKETVQIKQGIKPGSKGLGLYSEDDDFGVKMQTMSFAKDELVIEADKVIENFNNEELIRKDEEFAQVKRTNFAFGGLTVRDRIKKRKMNSKLGNEVSKLEKIILSKKGHDNDESGDEDSEGEGNEEVNIKRQRNQ